MPKIKQKSLVTFDIETDPFDGQTIPKPFLACVYDGLKYQLFCKYSELTVEIVEEFALYGYKDLSQVIPYLSSLDAICYAHNGGKFDYLYFKDDIPQDTDLLIIDGRLSSFTIGKCEFRDSYNLFAQRLSAWEKDQVDYSQFTEEHRYKPENWIKINEYIKSDCQYLREMLIEFKGRNGLGITLPSLMMKKVKRQKKFVPESSELFYERFNPFYYGGRVQCFQKGLKDINFKSADINSAYPWAMKNFKHPYGLEYMARDNVVLKENESIGPNMYRINCISGGAFPYRNPYTTELIFPSDDQHRDYFVTGWELIIALETGTVKDLFILREYKFEQLQNFEDFIEPLWEERKKAKVDGNIQLATFIKLEMNGLYGKFASNPSNYDEYKIISREKGKAFMQDEDFNIYHDLDYSLRGNFGKQTSLISKPLSGESKKYYNVATAASITGRVRAYLFDHLYKAKGLIYCDTDSIAAVDFPGLLIGEELGQWEIEGEYDHYRVVDKKVYAFHKENRPQRNHSNNWKKATKGGDLTPHQLKRLCKGKTILHKRNVPTYTILKEPYYIERNFKMSYKPIYKIEPKS